MAPTRLRHSIRPASASLLANDLGMKQASRFVLRLLECSVFFALTLAFTESASAAQETVVLAIGRSTEWAVSRAGPIVVSNGSIAQVSDRGGTVRVTGKRIGTTIVHSGERELEVRIVREPVYRDFDRLDRRARVMRGLVVATDGEAIRLKGRLLRWRDWSDLAAEARGLRTPIFFESEIDRSLLPTLESRFREVLAGAKIPPVELSYTNGASAFVPAEPADLKARVASVLGPFGFRVETSTHALSLEPLVRVKIVVAEIRKSEMRALGIDWPPAVQGQLLPNGVTFNESLFVTLQAFENAGHATVLASPTLLCRSGKEAQFLAGGEFPIKIANFGAQNVVWKKYGIMLTIRPKADLSGRMSVAIDTEVSAIDGSRVVDGVPGLLSNRITTHFDLTSSRTIALSGLIKRESDESISGLPGLRSLPILGRLFSSRRYMDGRTELLVFVTPEIVPMQGDNG